MSRGAGLRSLFFSQERGELLQHLGQGVVWSDTLKPQGWGHPFPCFTRWEEVLQALKLV